MDVELSCDVEDILLAYGEACMKIRLLEAQIKELRKALEDNAGGKDIGWSVHSESERASLQSE
jgi:hypothetical protein|tara:strand:+ start:546 stop:734 length:189 start_codon:yes stop_codon:yes gene_type:complete